MKKWLLTLAAITTLSACSTDNTDKQQANDSFVKGKEIPNFSTLSSGGVNLPQQDPRFVIPSKVSAKTGQAIDIRPPSKPLAIINNSVAQFDGERASIVYSADKQAIYNTEQISRLLTEKGIQHTVNQGKIQTDWASTGRADDVGDVQLRYQFEQLGNREASALTVSILQAKRDNVVFTPSVADKQRYTSDRLNQLIGELNQAYQKQQRDLANHSLSSMTSAIASDRNGRTALLIDAPFTQTWHKLAQVLPTLGFKTDEENIGRGYRLLEYKALDAKEWQRLGVTQPELKNDDYQMQLAVSGKQTALVISDEDGQPLNTEQAQAIYQALQALLAN
ncbi:outer membrane protein assembly factor BamC [Conservatibacter flavescens]|uniref:Outer membrane protein assembly factor BamC n=1 Tax=Conservatibacter flavescens TaxID=28161 RepID=A0A2M8S4A7_9PAST|nr:outer membrane protein assembly factor BamC [Conservatibacter flavescens]PJG85964.1 outer membrane assembly protein BamC [Conservatibacter flavescens]